MKLRIARIDDPNVMAGVFIIQRRDFCVWKDMFYDKVRRTLHTDMVLGNVDVVRAEFKDFHIAQGAAKRHMKKGKRIIRETWRIVK